MSRGTRRTFSGGAALLALAALAGGCDGDPAEPDASTPQDSGSTPDTGPGEEDAGTEPDAGPPVAPIFRNPVALSDEELAMQALRLMGAPEAGGTGNSCAECHAITRQNVRHFWDISDTAWRTCFSDLAVETEEAAQAIVDCFQNESGLYTTGNVGVFATGANFAWFRFVFERALGEGWETEYEAFRMRVQQPPDDHPALTQEEFDLLTEWFLRGTPWLENILPSVDGPGECTPYVDPIVSRIVAESALTGWTARNREASLLMHDCAGATNPLECMRSYPPVTTETVAAGWEFPAGSTHRLLFKANYESSYWTKISADGRFVANGGNDSGFGASVIDLERAVVIGADAAYDPGFFPDNSGFMFQGTSRGASVCMQNILTTSAPTRITFREAGCSRGDGLGLYQHVGASLDGGDYWVVTSLWSGDFGNSLRDPDVMSAADATLRLYRLLNSGSGYSVTGNTRIAVPWQANAVVSPTMRLLVTQLADAAGDPLGYVLHQIQITRNADGSVSDVALPEVARYCFPGGKAAMSLDDRWIITHHRATDEDAVDLGFEGPSDPGFAAYRGVSNVYVIDTVTGERTRITNMAPGQRALFPSFRSDGWVYYLARVGPTGSVPEYVVATDAVLRME